MKKYFQLSCILVLAVILNACLDTKSDPFISLNKAPQILQLKADKEILMPDSTVRIIVTASDPEKMDSIITFEWISESGKLTLTPDYIDTSKAIKISKSDTVYWKAPTTEGAFKITVSVIDNLKERKDSTIVLTVQKNPLIPGIPHTPLPADNAVNLASSIVLNWNCAGDQARILYDIYFGEENNLTRIDSNLKVKTYKLENLEYGKTYSWFIRAKYDNKNFAQPEKNWKFKIREIVSNPSNEALQWGSLVARGTYINGIKPDTLKISNDFEMMKFEVTTKQYVDFLNASKSNLKMIGDSIVVGYNDGDKTSAAGDVVYIFLKLAGITHLSGNFSTTAPNNPVSGVTYYGAKYFALYYKCLLPTYQEWQVAALGNQKFRYPWGTNQVDSTYANYKSGASLRGIKPVNTYPKNLTPYGLYDMVGNVWEWTNSSYNKSFAVGGGSYITVEAALPSYIFFYYAPQSAYPYIGFRCLRRK